MAEDGRLLQILCLLLGDPIFQCSAAECLLQIVNRKGKAEDRKQLMILFSEEALRFIYTAATAPPPLAGPTNFHENHYLFLKKLTQVIFTIIAPINIYLHFPCVHTFHKKITIIYTIVISGTHGHGDTTLHFMGKR